MVVSCQLNHIDGSDIVTNPFLLVGSDQVFFPKTEDLARRPNERDPLRSPVRYFCELVGVPLRVVHSLGRTFTEEVGLARKSIVFVIGYRLTLARRGFKK